MRYSREWKRAYHVTWCVLWPAHNGHEAWFRFSRCGITWPQVARKIGVRYWRGMHVCTAVCLDIRKNALTDIAPNAKVVPPPPLLFASSTAECTELLLPNNRFLIPPKTPLRSFPPLVSPRLSPFLSPRVLYASFLPSLLARSSC